MSSLVPLFQREDTEGQKEVSKRPGPPSKLLMGPGAQTSRPPSEEAAHRPGPPSAPARTPQVSGATCRPSQPLQDSELPDESGKKGEDRQLDQVRRVGRAGQVRRPRQGEGSLEIPRENS